MRSLVAPFRPSNCSVAKALESMGGKWNLLILREAFFGVRRFDELARSLGCARNILTDRLNGLVEVGLLERVAYRDEGRRERYEYVLTPKGRELYPVLAALRQWGDRWLQPSGPPMVLRHAECGAPARVELRCEAGHGPLQSDEIVREPGPGALRADLVKASGVPHVRARSVQPKVVRARRSRRGA